ADGGGYDRRYGGPSFQNFDARSASSEQRNDGYLSLSDGGECVLDKTGDYNVGIARGEFPNGGTRVFPQDHPFELGPAGTKRRPDIAMEELHGRKVGRVLEVAAENDLMALVARRGRNQWERIGVNDHARGGRNGLHEFRIRTRGGKNSIEARQPGALQLKGCAAEAVVAPGQHAVFGSGHALMPKRLDVIDVQKHARGARADLLEVGRAPELLDQGGFILPARDAALHVSFKAREAIDERRAVAQEAQGVSLDACEGAFGVKGQIDHVGAIQKAGGNGLGRIGGAR